MVWINEQDYAKKLYHRLYIEIMTVFWDVKKTNIYEMVKNSYC